MKISALSFRLIAASFKLSVWFLSFKHYSHTSMRFKTFIKNHSSSSSSSSSSHYHNSWRICLAKKLQKLIRVVGSFAVIHFRARLTVVIKVFATRLRYFRKIIVFHIVQHFSLAFLNSFLAFQFIFLFLHLNAIQNYYK